MGEGAERREGGMERVYSFFIVGISLLSQGPPTIAGLR